MLNGPKKTPDNRTERMMDVFEDLFQRRGSLTEKEEKVYLQLVDYFNGRSQLMPEDIISLTESLSQKPATEADITEQAADTRKREEAVLGRTASPEIPPVLEAILQKLEDEPGKGNEGGKDRIAAHFAAEDVSPIPQKDQEILVHHTEQVVRGSIPSAMRPDELKKSVIRMLKAWGFHYQGIADGGINLTKTPLYYVESL